MLEIYILGFTPWDTLLLIVEASYLSHGVNPGRYYYESIARICNSLFTLLNEQLNMEGKTKEQRRIKYQGVISAPFHKDFQKWHEELGKLLK